ncbi:hypothetical protein Gasu2_70540 [Galdieria sulphuraria]|nr:hypothetical protein Gasu2_70540 [Galdieria sulphuraria]
MLVATSSGESIESPKTETLTQQSKNETAIPRQQWKRAPLTAVDAFYAGIALVYLLFFGLGTWRNLNISKQLGQLLSSCASSQFAWTGVDKDGKLLYQDGIANYIFYASGRRYITWLKCELELKHRQDPFFYFRRPFENRWNMRDRLHIRVSLREQKDFARNTRTWKTIFELYSESLELARKILAEDRMLQILNKYGHLIQRIYICEETSKSSNENETLKKWIDIQSIIPSDFTGVQDFLLLACWLSDYISTVQLSAGVLQRSEKLRNMVKEDEEKAKEKKRKEQILKEKQEKKQQDTSDVFSLSRSAQKKLEEKQRKAELKKKSKKGFRFLAV